MKSKHITEKIHAMVTGGSGGIGREIVRELAARGVKIISFTYGKNKATADALAKELKRKGVRTYYASIERTDEKAFRQFLSDAVSALGTEITMAVDTVGTSPNIPFLNWTVEDFMETYRVNAVGSMLMTRSVAERMRKHEVHGSIVLITSTNGVDSHAEYSIGYDMSKAAQILGMVIAAKRYARSGQRINGLAPGWVRTPMNDTLPPGEEEKESAKIWTASVRVDPFAAPAEIAAVVHFLLSRDASYLVGQNIKVDGGYSPGSVILKRKRESTRKRAKGRKR